MRPERLVLRACGQRIDLRLYEGTYPRWRELELGLDASERVDGLTIAPRILRLVSQLRDVDAVDLEFSDCGQDGERFLGEEIAEGEGRA